MSIPFARRSVLPLLFENEDPECHSRKPDVRLFASADADADMLPPADQIKQMLRRATFAFQIC